MARRMPQTGGRGWKNRWCGTCQGGETTLSDWSKRSLPSEWLGCHPALHTNYVTTVLKIEEFQKYIKSLT